MWYNSFVSIRFCTTELNLLDSLVRLLDVSILAAALLTGFIQDFLELLQTGGGIVGIPLDRPRNLLRFFQLTVYNHSAISRSTLSNI